VFTISLPQTIKFGFGVAKEAGYEARRLGIRRALMVVGPRLAEEVKASLEAEGIEVRALTRVKIEPMMRL